MPLSLPHTLFSIPPLCTSSVLLAFNAQSSPYIPYFTTGRWDEAEQAAFEQGLQRHGRDWKMISCMVPTRSLTQIRTHAQKYFKKKTREACEATHIHAQANARTQGRSIIGGEVEQQRGVALMSTANASASSCLVLANTPASPPPPRQQASGGLLVAAATVARQALDCT